MIHQTNCKKRGCVHFKGFKTGTAALRRMKDAQQILVHHHLKMLGAPDYLASAYEDRVELGEAGEAAQLPVCEAFPEGIPEEIAYGRNPHLLPYPGDHGIQYARKG